MYMTNTIDTASCMRAKSLLQNVSDSATLWTVACQAPLPWESPDKNTGVGFHAIL